MKRIRAGIAVIVGGLTLVTAPAAAQNGSAWLDPKAAEPLESAGQVVLTVSLWRAGRVEYRTMDGACEVTYSAGGSPPEAVCSGEKARAPQDYTATSGELVFTAGGSKTITIPIVDDELSEGYQSFTLAAWEEVNADPWIDRGDSVIVRIVDDDGGDTRDQEPSGSALGNPTPNRASGTGVTVDPTTPKAATPPSRNLHVTLAAEELRPGPGFELTSERAPEPALAPGGGGGSAWSLAYWLGAAAVGVGAVAVVRRRRRWSPTQA